MRYVVLASVLLAACVGDNPNAIQDGFRYDLTTPADLAPAPDMVTTHADLARASDLATSIDLQSTDLAHAPVPDLATPPDLAPLCRAKGDQCTVGTECCSGTCEGFGVPPTVTYICA